MKRLAILIGAYIIPKGLSSKFARYFLHVLGIGYAVEVVDSGEIRLLQRLFKRKSTILVFDIGGNVGHYTESICKKFPQAKVHVFEPSKVHFELLSQRLESYQDRCKNNNFGLGERDEQLILHKDSQITGSATLIDRNVPKFNTILELVSIRSIRGYITEQKIHKIDFMKIDVEGWEFPIIQSLEYLLDQSSINYIQFEITLNTIECGQKISDFFDLFNKYGYKIFTISPSGGLNLVSYDDDLLRIYMSTNYVAVAPKIIYE